jgi:hypothetical protein
VVSDSEFEGGFVNFTQVVLDEKKFTMYKDFNKLDLSEALHVIVKLRSW